MPMTPMPVRASLTSSSLNGLMIASIFFMRSPPRDREKATAVPARQPWTPAKSGGCRQASPARARASRRPLSEQLKYYTYLGMVAADNPDLPLSMIEGILEAREEFKAGLGKPYEWGVIR